MTETLSDRRHPTEMSSAALPSHLRVTVLQAKDLKLKGIAPSGLHVVVKTVQSRHVTSKLVAPEWNEHFEFPLMGLDTIVKVSVKCKGTFGEEKLVGCTFISLKDFNVLDRPVTKWYGLHSKSNTGNDSKSRGMIQLTIGFVARWKSTEALDLATDEPESDNSSFKRFALNRFSLRKSLKRQNSQSEGKRRRRGGSKEPLESMSADNLHSSIKQEASIRSPASSSSGPIAGSSLQDLSQHFHKATGSREASPQMKPEGTHPHHYPLPHRPTRLFIAGAGSESVHTTPVEETCGEPQDTAEEGKVRVRLRRRRAVSGSLTPSTPVRASTFIYTNGFSKESLTNSLQSSGDHEGSSFTEGAHKGSRIRAKESEGREGDNKKGGTNTMVENRLQRFERRSFRLKESKLPTVRQVSPKLVHSKQASTMDASKDVSLTGREPADVEDSDSCSSPDVSPSHSRSKSDETSNESGGNKCPSEGPSLLSSEATQRLMLSSSSSALTVSSSASSHSLQQQPTASTTPAQAATVPVLETDPLQAALPSAMGVDETQKPMPPNKASHSVMEGTQKVDGRPQQKAKLKDLSSLQLRLGVLTHTRTGSLQGQESARIVEDAPKETDEAVSLAATESMQDLPHVGNPFTAEDEVHTPTQKEKTSKLRRRHTVEYPRDLAKYRKDFKMESVLPPSMMTMNRASAVSESDESTDQLPLDDVPPRPHSAITFSGQITPSQGRPSSGQDVSSPGGRGSFAGPPYSSPTTKKEFSLPGRCNFDRRRNETGMKRLLNLSAQAMRHRSSTLPRPLTASPSTDPLQTSSSATSLKPQVKKDCILEEGQMRKTCSMPSRGNPSLDKTDGEDASEKNPMEMTREELIMELENSRETVIQLELELESLQSYNSLLLAKVMEHCPQILEMKM